MLLLLVAVLPSIRSVPIQRLRQKIQLKELQVSVIGIIGQKTYIRESRKYDKEIRVIP